MIPEKVQSMIDNPGVYVITAELNPLAVTVIFSKGGKLIVLKVDRELDPTRFTEGMRIVAGPITSYDGLC